MALTKQPYSAERLDQVRRLLQRSAEAGKKQDYEILIDQFTVVPRTDDVSLFNSYESEIESNASASQLTVRIYAGNSNNCDRYIYYLKDVPAEASTQKGALNGIQPNELGSIIDKAVTEKKLQWDFENLKEKYAKLEADHKELQGINSDLEEKLEATENRHGQMNMFGTIAGPLLDQMMKTSSVLKNSPLAGFLGAGAGAEENQEPTHNYHQAPAPSFEPISGASNASNLDPSLVQYCEFMFNSFTQDEAQYIDAIVKLLARDKKNILTVFQMLQN